MRFALALLLAAACSRAPIGERGSIQLTSPAFDYDHNIPAKYTCVGENISPPLRWSGVTGDARSLEISLDDPDAPGGHFKHWHVTQIPPLTREIGEGQHIGVEDTNGFGKPGYGGPCPPSGEHRYLFTLRALDANGREVGRGELVGRFRK
jgi:Raf kinase inhibitor-like YbhB/YbcL family protein